MNNQTHSLIKVLAALLIAILFLASCEGNASVNEDISLQTIRRHLEFIASEKTEGRMTATEGYKKAALGSGGFPEHHTPYDNLDLIDFRHLHRAALFVLDYVKELGNN